MQNQEIISTREARQYKKALRQKLEIEAAYAIADTLVTMGIYHEIDAFLPLLTSQNCIEKLKIASSISGLNRGFNTSI